MVTCVAKLYINLKQQQHEKGQLSRFVCRTTTNCSFSFISLQHTAIYSLKIRCEIHTIHTNIPLVQDFTLKRHSILMSQAQISVFQKMQQKYPKTAERFP